MQIPAEKYAEYMSSKVEKSICLKFTVKTSKVKIWAEEYVLT